MVASARKKFLAVLVGIVLAGVPTVAFNYWLSEQVERKGREEVETSARRAIALAETRISRALVGLDKLSSQGVASCEPANLEALRRVTFAVSSIKEFSVVGPDGETQCSALGLAREEQPIASQRVAGDGDLLIEILRFGNRQEPMVRLRRPSAAAGAPAALIPVDLMMLQLTTQGNPFSADARLTLQDGSPVGVIGTSAADGDGLANRFVAIAKSEHYGLSAMISMTRESVLASHHQVRVIGMAISGVFALMMILFALLVPWRLKRDSIADIEQAFEAGEFVPYYQPVMDIRTGQLRGAEVLARRRRPDGSIALPATFIPLMESSGLIIEFTRALMRRARDEVGAAYEQRPHLRLGFNLAARDLADERIVADLRDIFDGSPVRLSQVVLEVTERQPLDNLTETRRVIAALQGVGVRIAIDDVGSGHSGLSYILKLGVDTLKIDKMFIDAIGSDHNSSKIIETLVDLARNLRMDIIAEGVETFEQVVYLRNIGILAAQGYVFAPPLPGSSFLQLVDAVAPAQAEQHAPAPARYMSARNRFEAA